MPSWIPVIKTTEDELVDEQIRLEEARQKASLNIPAWLPQANIPAMQTPITQPAIQPATQPKTAYTFSPVSIPEPTVNWPSRQEEQAPAWATSVIPQVQPPSTPAPVAEPVKPVKTETASAKDYSKELDPLHPFKIDANLPLWAKTLSLIGKPFDVIQEYVFDPVLGVAHQPWAQKNMTPDEIKQANKEGILSYFPGGLRHQSYEELQYTGKFVVELLPWLIVPPVGAVGKVGQGASGIAGALGKLGKAGEVAGRVLEYSPAGLTEKATGAAISAITGKATSVAASAIKAVDDPFINKMNGFIRAAQSKLPEQKIMTHELRVQQLDKAMPELQKGNGEQALRNFMNALKGEGEKVEWGGIRSQLSNTEIDSLSNMIKQSTKVIGFDKAPAISGWRKILDGPTIPFDSELEQLEKVFGPETVQALLDKKPTNIINKISDVANAPRAVLSAVDLSGLLRQGAILSARYPVQALKSVAPMVKAFFRDENAKLVDDVIRARPRTRILEEGGMYLAPLPGKATPLSKMEESFMSKWVESIPIIGPAVKASNRAYVTGLNDLRSRVGENVLSSWEKLGVEITDKDLKGLGKLINSASGRGSLPKALQGSSPLLNAMMFSPRLFISRLQFPAMLASESPLVRKEAARMLVQFLGAGTAILGMAKVMGAGIELDPRSADFAKIKIGNTRLDIWSGYAQWARFIAQLTTEQRKTSGGNIVQANRYDVAERFLQSKNSPAAGLLFDILRGESYSGEQVDLQGTDIQRQAYTRLMPLFLQDMIDAIDQEGLAGGMVALPGLFGVGVVTYMSPAQKMREKLAQDKYGMSWEQLGKDRGLAAQLDLERGSPELLALQQKENQEYDQTIAGKSDIGNIYRNQTETIEREYRSRINLATQEYRDTGDGYSYKEKILEAASNRRSQYDILNKDPQFADIVARYDELPTPADLNKLSPQDWARKEYMRLMYSPDMYDQYGNYRFDRVDDMRTLFVNTFGQSMLDYVETYQNTKESDMPPEYKLWREAQNALKPYWAVQDQVEKMFGKAYAASSRGQAMIQKQRKLMRRGNPDIARYYDMFYRQTA